MAAANVNKWKAFAQEESTKYDPHPAIAHDQVGSGSSHRFGPNYLPLSERAVARNVENDRAGTLGYQTPSLRGGASPAAPTPTVIDKQALKRRQQTFQFTLPGPAQTWVAGQPTDKLADTGLRGVKVPLKSNSVKPLLNKATVVTSAPAAQRASQPSRRKRADFSQASDYILPGPTSVWFAGQKVDGNVPKLTKSTVTQPQQPMQVDSDLRATTVTEATAVSLSKPLPPATKPEDEDTLIICSARPSQQALRPPSNQMPSAAEKKGVNSFATSTQSVNETREPSQYVPPNNHPVEQSKRNTSICSQGNGISANALEEKFHAMGLNDPLVPTVDTPSRSNQHDLPRPQHAAKDQDAPAVADGRTTLSTTASIGSTMPPAEWDREPQSATTPVALDQTIHPGTQAPQVPHAIPWEPPALAVPWFGSSGSHKVDMYGYPNQFLHADPYAPVPQWNGQGLTTLSGDQNDVERGASTGLNATHAMHASHPVGAATHQSTAEDPSAVKRGVAELCLKIRSTDDVVHTFILSVDDPDPFQTLRVFCHTRGLNAYVGALWKEVQSRLI